MPRDVFKRRVRHRIPIVDRSWSKWLKLGGDSLNTRSPQTSINTTFRNKIEATEATSRSRRRTPGHGFLVLVWSERSWPFIVRDRIRLLSQRTSNNFPRLTRCPADAGITRPRRSHNADHCTADHRSGQNWRPRSGKALQIGG
jgi:hypothetical protein